VVPSFTADGKTLIASPGGQERAWHAWEAVTGKPADGLKLPEGHNYAQPAVAPDNRTLLFAQARYVQGSDGCIRLWDLRAGKMLHTLGAEGPIGPFFPDGKSFLSNAGVLQRWELATGRPLLPENDKMCHQSEVIRAVYSPDGRRLATTALNDAICLWDVATARPLHLLKVRGGNAIDLAFTPDGRFLVSGGLGYRGELDVWDTQTGKEVRRIPLQNPEPDEKQLNILRLQVTPDGRTVIVLGYSPRKLLDFSGFLSCLDLATGQEKTRVKAGTSDGPYSLYSAFSADGSTLASCGELLDTTTGKPRVKLEGGPRPLSHYAFSSDGLLVAGFATRTVIDAGRISNHMDGIAICDAASGRVVRRIPTDWVGQLAFSPDGRYLAAASLQGIRLWELASWEIALEHKGHEIMHGSYGHSFASCLSFAPDGRSLATGHPDSTVLIWSMAPSVRSTTAADLPRLWDDLVSSDAAKAYAASWQLTDAPKEAVRFLQERLRPVSRISAEQIRPLLADLDSDEFQKREAAAARLQEMDNRAEKLLKEALLANPSPEKRRRLKSLLKTLEGPPSGEVLRQLRAIAVLERIGTAEAQQVLKKLAKGIPESPITRDAKTSLARLTYCRRAEQP
jgi:WD40 repeat protein